MAEVPLNFQMDKHDSYIFGQEIGFALKLAAFHDLRTEEGRETFRKMLDEKMAKSEAYWLLQGMLEAMY